MNTSMLNAGQEKHIFVLAQKGDVNKTGLPCDFSSTAVIPANAGISCKRNAFILTEISGFAEDSGE